ncbi:MAG: glutamine--fructose-6-phosphate transaminase (isomerizing) [Clostridiales bacterium]|nr:glutamine--fructose-6-phosphate transaminase (isomerizing) [Clostridiales bacterium]
MCGITAYIGKQNALKILVNNLKKLEYRGYDSAGLAFFNQNNLNFIKCSGKVNELEQNVNFKTKSTCGITHTRWATHGSPNKDNAHPHFSFNNNWAIVHNGIIENYKELKNELLSNNISFKSETDTEVIAHLLGNDKTENKIMSLINTCKKLEGSYALACLHKDYANTLFLARKKSPLYVAIEQNEIFVASDIICFNEKVKEYYSLGDNQFCIATPDCIVFYNSDGEIISLKPKKLKNIQTENSKQNYPHYMLKEINEVPQVLKNIIKTYKNKQILYQFNKNFIKNFNKIILVGCGTAYHAAQLGAKYLNDFANMEAHAYIASEFRYSNVLINNKTLCIFVSQSGETADTLAACEQAKKHNTLTVALSNVLTSTLCNMCDIILPVCAGQEIAVASTKAYSAQIAILYMFAKHLQNVIYNQKEQYFTTINNLANNLIILEQNNFVKICQELTEANKVFFIGRCYDYITCLEASLKLKEITYIFSAEHPAGELKHGFLALIDESCVLFAIATNKNLLDKTLNGAYEASARGAKVIVVSQIDLPEGKLNNFYGFIKLQNFKEEIMPIASISFFQMLAYATCVSKGFNPDQPRNLAKSVTVE